MKRPAELDDEDRQQAHINREAAREQEALARVLRETRDAARPMGVSKRIPSPYADAEHREPPRPIRRETDGAAIAGACFVLAGLLLSVTGAVTWFRWVVEAWR